MGFGSKLRSAVTSADKGTLAGSVLLPGAGTAAGYAWDNRGAIGDKVNDITGATAAKDAAARQQAMAQQAVSGYNYLTNAGNQQAAGNIINRMATGQAAPVDQASFQQNVAQPLMQTYNDTTQKAINQQFSRNPWSASRSNSQQSALQDIQSQMRQAQLGMQEQATQNQQSALNAIMGGTQGQANAQLGQASMVQAAPSALDKFSKLATAGSQGVNALGGAAKLAALV